jgi:CO/xanthine dehydrogenase FAD-binding subunit
MVAQDVHLLGDQHASGDFRAHLSQVLTRRALARAIDRAAAAAPAPGCQLRPPEET